MKKILLAALVLALATTAANAQNSGWILSGSLGVSVDDQKDFQGGDKVTSFEISPKVHRMLGKNWAIGLGLSYGQIKYKEADKKSNMFTIEPSAIYYLRISDKFYYAPTFFFGVGFGEDAYDNDLTAVEGGGKPFSFEFRPSDSFGITLSAGKISYRSVKYEQGGQEATHKTFKFGITENIEMGLRYYF